MKREPPFMKDAQSLLRATQGLDEKDALASIAEFLRCIHNEGYQEGYSDGRVQSFSRDAFGVNRRRK